MLTDTRNKGNEGLHIGKIHKAANDSNIGVYGRQTIEGMTDDWSPVVVNAEVADVRRCLGSVIRMCEAGKVVHFETGHQLHLEC